MFAVAADHGYKSIFSYTDLDITRRQSAHIRRAVLIIACRWNPDYVVVSTKDLSWACRRMGYESIIVGYPDILHWSDLEIAKMSEAPINKQLPFSKIGFSVGENFFNENYDDLRKILRSISAQKHILEPYFEDRFSYDYIKNVLYKLQNVSGLHSLKLSLKDEKCTYKVFPAVINDCKWLSRSGGMPFSKFKSALSDAISNGCEGAIVGSAIWGTHVNDIYHSPNSSGTINSIHSRMEAIDNIIR